MSLVKIALDGTNKALSRRGLFKAGKEDIFTLTLLSLLTSCSSQQIYTFVDKKGITSSHLSLLEQSLNQGNSDIPIPQDFYNAEKGGPEVTLVGRFPEIIINFNVNTSVENTSLATLISQGSAYFLNSEGFFLTAYHVVQDIQEGINSNLMLVYDPQTGLISQGRVLMYSKEYDLALGKVDDIENFEPLNQAEQLTNKIITPVDTDQDGLSDEEESRLGTNINSTDTDQDGLFDLEEVKVYKTDPTNPDTDGDGYLDGEEVANGFDPNGPGRLLEF